MLDPVSTDVLLYFNVKKTTSDAGVATAGSFGETAETGAAPTSSTISALAGETLRGGEARSMIGQCDWV